MSDFLLTLWVALIGADRVDLLGGHGPFILTPFLALTPVVTLGELLRRSGRGAPVLVSRGAVRYAALALGLVAVVFFSVFVAQETTVAASRASLLGADVASTFVVVLLTTDREDLMALLARGAILALPTFLLFDVVEALYWIGHAPQTARFGPALLQFGQLQNAGPFPRLAGATGDSNRGGFVVLFYAVVIAKGERRRSWRLAGLTASIIVLLLTISRSAGLAAATTFVTMMLAGRLRFRPAVVLGVCLSMCAAGALLVANPRLLARAQSVANVVITSRLATNEGSASSHVALIERGVAEGSASVQRSLFGLGYGNSYLVLQDVFPGNKYGNFHSLYVSVFVEAGIFGLLLMLVLLLTPLARGGAWRPLIAGALTFNIFYQSPTEPAFWLLLALAWLVPWPTESFARGTSDSAYRGPLGRTHP